MRVLLGIPMYRCADQAVRVFTSLESARGSFTSAVFVDNRSPDGTVDAVLSARGTSSFAPQVEIRRNRENYGLGGSHKVIFDLALAGGYDVVVVLHGDDQASVDDMSRLLGVLKEAKSGMVLGSRFMRGSIRRNYQASRVWGNRALNLAYTLLTGRPTHDLGSGLNAFSVKDLARLPYHSYSDGFTFNVDLLLGCYRAGIPVTFAPILWREEDQVSNARNFPVALKMLKCLLRWRLGIGSAPTSRSEWSSDLAH